MNAENIDKVLARLRQIKPAQFNMKRWFQRSTTTPIQECGCIGGWAEQIMLVEMHENSSILEEDQIAWFGLTEGAFYELTHPLDLHFDEFPLQRCIDVVQHLRDTGEVDWSRFPAENYGV